MKLTSGGPKRTGMALSILLLSMALIVSVNSACQKKAEEAEPAAAGEQRQKAMIMEGINTLEGTVKLAHGPFLYIPEIVGFDVILPLGVDTSGLEGQAVRVEGEFYRERPSIFMVNRLYIREGENSYKDFFNRAGEEDPVLFNQHDRESFPALTITSPTAAEAWQGKEKGKVFGKLEKQTVTEGGAAKDVYAIQLLDDKGKLTGKILVDSMTDYALYCIKKLRLFDSFWFYLNIKDTVEAKTRARTKDLFHADVVFTGLY